MNSARMPGFSAEASVYKTGEHYRTVGAPIDLAGSRGVLPQARQRDDWTTNKVCQACGCTVSGFVCNCGMPPNPRKLECIRNGGPGRGVGVLGAGTGGKVLQGNLG
jgi:hypothetical protein